MLAANAALATLTNFFIILSSYPVFLIFAFLKSFEKAPLENSCDHFTLKNRIRQSHFSQKFKNFYGFYFYTFNILRFLFSELKFFRQRGRQNAVCRRELSPDFSSRVGSLLPQNSHTPQRDPTRNIF